MTYWASVDNPWLRHSPVVKLTIIVNKGNNEQPNAKEEEIELVLSGALYNKACLLAHSMDLSVKVHTKDQIYYSVEHTNYILVDIDSSCIGSCKYDISSEKNNYREEGSHYSFVYRFRILHTVHYDVVTPEESQNEEMICWSWKVKNTNESLYWVWKPKWSSIFV